MKRGIFQGDSLSPHLFCMSIDFIKMDLQRTGYGCWISSGCGETAKRYLVSYLLLIQG